MHVDFQRLVGTGEWQRECGAGDHAVGLLLRVALPVWGTIAPATAGILRPLTLVAESGSIVDARPPAPVAGECGDLAADRGCADAGLAQAVPDRVSAAGERGNDEQSDDRRDRSEKRAGIHVLRDDGRRDGGATGNRWHFRSADAHDEFAEYTDEALEYAYPFRVRRYAYRRGSGGEGRFRVGTG